MVWHQTDISLWCRPRGPTPGGNGAGPLLASRGSTQATGGSANLETRGRQSNATGPTTPTTDLRIVQWNAEGVYNKKPELQVFLRQHCVDVICIQESHLSEARRFFVRGYDVFRRDRPTGHKGGILTLVKHNIPAVLTAQTSDDSDLEYITIKIFLNTEELFITNCYSPSTSRLDLHKIDVQPEKHLIVGDFNGHSPAWGYADSDSRGEEIQDWLIDNNLTLINQPGDKPTYYSRAWKKTSTPDLAMATDDVQKLSTRKVMDQLGGSDHTPAAIHITGAGTNTELQRKRASWNFKKANWNQYQLHAEAIQHITFAEDINLSVKKVTEGILAAARKHIPRGFRRDYKPFWSKRLENLHQKLTKAREKMEASPTTENITRHSHRKEEFEKTKVLELQESWHEKTSTLSLDKSTGKLWRLTKALNEDTTTRRGATVLEDNNNFHTGKSAANLLANTFQTDSTIKVPPQRGKEVKAQLQTELQQQADPCSSMTTDFTIAELNDAIRRLKSGKSPGKDGICNEMIKHLGSAARSKLLELYNQSWRMGVFPSAWKEATIVPILKKNKDPKNKTSYRPISLLSCLGKTMERMVNRRLVWHLETNNLISSEQTAFRKNRSTEDQLTYLSQSVENAFQEKKKVVATFVDLSEAFDKVWKDGLLLKLSKAKISGLMFKWIKSFLCHRTARVKLDQNLSNVVKIKEGVPQGGVISPTLFVIFINDIAKNLPTRIPRALHADDFAVWNAAESTATATIRMQEALNIISKWAKDWCVSINSEKTVSICFSLSNVRENLRLTVNNEPIPQEDTVTYLGLRFDRKLTWKPQISETENRATRRLALLKKLAGTKWGASGRILRQVYTGNVRPVMEYGSAAWSTAAKSNTSKLTKVQNTGMRIITGALKTTPILAMETTSRLAPLQQRREEKVLIQSEKLHRLTSHPVHKQLQEFTKNRLKRQSFNHLAKQLTREMDTLPTNPEEREPLQDMDDWRVPTHNILLSTEVPGITTKKEQDTTLRTLTLEMLDRNYNGSVWTHAYTDGSSDAAVRNGGSGIHIRYPNNTTTSRSLPCGQLASNYRSELVALREAARLLLAESPPPPNIVFLSDCKSIIQSLQSPREQIERETQYLLSELSQHSEVAVQWIPAHCGLSGNEEADRLAKSGSRAEQTHQAVSHREAKAIIKRHFQNIWTISHNPPPDDQIHHLSRHQQTTIFRLRTGHCRLRSHMHRLGLSHTPDCPCNTGPETPEHILQHCPLHHDIRVQCWPQGSTLQEKLWGPRNNLTETASFIKQAKIEV